MHGPITSLGTSFPEKGGDEKERGGMNRDCVKALDSMQGEG